MKGYTGKADVKSVAQIVKFLAGGDTDIAPDNLDSVSDVMKDFIKCCDSNDPASRQSAVELLEHNLFDQ